LSKNPVTLFSRPFSTTPMSVPSITAPLPAGPRFQEKRMASPKPSVDQGCDPGMAVTLHDGVAISDVRGERRRKQPIAFRRLRFIPRGEIVFGDRLQFGHRLSPCSGFDVTLFPHPRRRTNYVRGNRGEAAARNFRRT
jgi:hypothetical protein